MRSTASAPGAGGVGGSATPFETVTYTGAAVPMKGVDAVARALSECAPSDVVVVSHDILNGGATIAGPSGSPSSRNCTDVIPDGSEAVALTVIVWPDTTVPAAGAVSVTLGGVEFGCATLPTTVTVVPV